MAAATIELYRSDDLAGLRELVDKLLGAADYLKELIQLPAQIPVVVDANQALADACYKARARVPNYRTHLEELADSRSIVAHAPQWLEEEVAKRLSEVAADYGVSMADAQSAWEDYRKRIIFHAVEVPPEISIADPKDAPYVALSNALGGAIIVTRDAAIRGATPRVANPQDLGRLKQAVRLSVPVAKARISWVMLTLILVNGGNEGVAAIGRLLSDRRVQKVVLLALGTATVAAAFYLSKEENRAKARKTWDEFLVKLGPLLDAIVETMRSYETMKVQSQQAWAGAVPFAQLTELDRESTDPAPQAHTRN